MLKGKWLILIVDKKSNLFFMIMVSYTIQVTVLLYMATDRVISNFDSKTKLTSFSQVASMIIPFPMLYVLSCYIHRHSDPIHGCFATMAASAAEIQIAFGCV